MDQTGSQSDIKIRSVDASNSELDFTDDFEDSLKKVKTGLLTGFTSLYPYLTVTIINLHVSMNDVE